MPRSGFRPSMFVIDITVFFLMQLTPMAASQIVASNNDAYHPDTSLVLLPDRSVVPQPPGTLTLTPVSGPLLSPVRVMQPSNVVDFEKRKAEIFASVDQNGNKIHDELDSIVREREAAGAADEPVRVIVAVEDGELDRATGEFKSLGGVLYQRYEGAFYGFAGDIPYSAVTDVSSLWEVELVERDQPMMRMSDLSTLLTGVRNYVWDTLGYTGDPNSSIAVLDTGIDDTHPMLSPYGDLDFANAKIVGWHDATGDGSTSPEDMNSHGSHCAGIAAGKEYASETGDGRIQTTWGIKYPYSSLSGGASGYFVYYIDVKSPGLVEVKTLWSGTSGVMSNDVILRTPNGTYADHVVSSASQRDLSALANATDIGLWSVWIHVSFPSGLNQEFRATGVNTYPYDSPTDGHLRFSGVAPDTKLVSVKVFDNTGSGSSTDLVNGLDWVYNNAEKYHITVASMSLGFSDTVASVDSATAKLVSKGIVTCVSAGNDGQGANNINTPGHVDEVICVGATGDHNQVTSYSSQGPGHLNTQKPDLVAPGGVSSQGAILSVDSNDQEADGAFSEQQPNDMAIMQGTSMSCPYVAGLAALLVDAMGGYSSWTYDSTANPFTVKQILMMTSYEVWSHDRGGKDVVEGYGRVCADAALEAYLYEHVIGTAETGTIVTGDAGRKAWARHMSLTAGTIYTFDLDVPAMADFDLFLYDGAYDTYGEPVLLRRSINFAPGASEHITFTPSTSGTYYIVVKYVTGEGGTFTLSSRSGTSFPSVSFNNPAENDVLTGSLTVQVSASGTGLSSVELRFWNDTWIDITSGYNSGTGYYEYTMNVSCIETGNVTFVARATSPSGTSYASVNVYVSTSSPQILLVDDDNGASYESYYKAALEDLGLKENVAYDVWTVSSDGSPSASKLQSYVIVIWFTSDDYQTTLSDTDRANLQTFLNGGGKLFISGQDIGYDSSNSNWESWIQTYLHGDYANNDDTNGNAVNGVAGDAVFDGVSYSLGDGDGGGNNGYPDEISPINGGIQCLTYDVTGTPGAAVRYAGTYRVVYFGFNFEAISYAADRTDAMDRVLDFLGLDLAPSLQVSSPSRFSWVYSPVTVSWTATDDVSVSYVEVYLDGQLTAHVTNSSVQVTVSEGNHTLRVVAVDSIGQITVRQVIIYVDNTDPTITFLSPAAGAVVKSGTTVDVDVSDEHLDTVYYRWDSRVWQVFTSPYDTVVPSGDGPHTLYVNATDLAGNLAASSRQFVCDDTAPTITLVSPAAGSVQQSGVTVDLDVSDAHLSTVRYHWDSDAWADLPAPFDTTIPSGDGDHTLYVNATDEAGNYALVSYTFTTDDTQPTVTLISPANNTVQSGGTTVDLSVSDLHLSTVYYRWDSGSWAVLPAPYDTQIPETEGMHILYVNATDEAGNVRRETYVWTVPSTGSAPSVWLVSPPDESVNQSGTTIDLNITDADGDLGTVYYWWDIGSPAVLPSPYDTSLPSGDGPHTLYVNATDSAGHYTYVSFSFITDDTPPSITLDSPPDGSVIRSGTTVYFNVTDLNSIVSILYAWDAAGNLSLPGPYNKTTYNVSTSGLSEGLHTLTLYATDEAGNEASAQYTYTVDDTPPSITLVSPPDGSEIQSGTTIDLDVTDPHTVQQVLYNWDGGSNASLSSPYDVSTTGLSEGSHTLNVYASDGPGNWAFASYSFVVDDTPPSVVLNSPADGSEIRSGTLIDLDVSDTNTLDTVLYAWDGGTETSLASPYDVPTSGLSEGTHTLAVSARDAAGNWANVTYSFIIDDTPPSITLLSPAEGSYVTDGDTIDTDVHDDNTLQQVLYGWDGLATNSLSAPYDITVSGLSDGSHTLNISARDAAGNWAIATYTFVVDNTPPSIALLSPSDSSVIQSGTIIDLDVTDAISLSQVLYHWDSDTNSTLPSPYDVSTAGLNEGPHQLYVFAEDGAGNWASSTYSFTIDDTAPTITLLSPSDGAEIQSGTAIDLDVTDGNGVSSVTYNWDGESNATLASPYDVDTTGLSEGAHVLHVYAEDLASNTASATFTFTVDDTPPAIVLNSPSDGSEIQSGTTVDLDVSDANTLAEVHYNWDGGTNQTMASPYDVQASGLTEGSHTLNVFARDEAGNEASASYTFVIDDTSPTITLVSPSDGSEIQSGTDVNLDVSDSNTLYEVLYNWDGGTNSTLASPYDVTTSGLTEGSHMLEVYARDEAGNWASATFTFVIDDTAPVVSLLAPPDGSEVRSGTVVDLDVTDDNTLSEVRYNWDGGTNNSLASPYDIPMSSLSEGAHTLHVFATDAAGNTRSETYSFVVDDTAPTITLLSPSDGAEIPSGTDIDLSVSETNTLAQVAYNWDGATNTSLSSPYVVSTSGLSEGTHTLYVYASDAAGNEGSEQYSFVIDDTAPSIVLNSPTEGSEIQPGTIIDLDIADSNTLYEALYAWDSAANQTLPVPFDVSTSSLSDGAHVLRVYARDAADNWASAQYTFVIDSTAPVITLISPTNGSVVATGDVIDLDISEQNTLHSASYRWDSGSSTSLTSPFDIDVTGLSEGQHTLVVSATDAAGNTAEESYVFIVDDTAPEIAVLSPPADTVHQSGSTMRISVTDPHLASVRYHWDTGSWVAWSSPYETTLPSGEGSHTLYVEATDEAGNLRQAQFSWVCDDTSPVVVLNGPANTTTHHSGTSIDLSVSDLHLQEVLYRWDSDAWATLAAPFDTYLPAGDGPHELHVNASDEAGNWAYERYLFYTDDATPLVILYSPANNTVQPSGTLVNVSITDDDLDTVLYRWDSGTWSVWPAPYDTQVPAPEGTHRLEVFVNDTAGNVESPTYVFVTDDTVPSILLLSPANGTVSRSGTTIDLDVSDAHLDSVVIQWDSGSWASLSAPYDTLLPSADGSHTLVINATDAAGHLTVRTFVFVTDDTAPTIVLEQPSNETVHRSGVTVDVSVVEVNMQSVQFRWDASGWSSWSEPFITMLPTGDGTHTLEVTATDEAGNTASAKYVFYVDDTAPSIALVSPANSTVQTSGTEIYISVVDPHLSSVLFRWDAGQWATGSSSLVTEIPSGDGTHVLTVNATDSIGNWALTSYSWTVDDTPPLIVLLSPANNSVLNSGVLVDLNVSDDHLLSVTYQWDGGTSGTLESPYDLTVPAGDGIHTLVVNATDAVSHSTLVNLVFIVDDTAPSVALASPNNATIHRSGTAVLVSVVEVHLETVMVSWDGGVWVDITVSSSTTLPVGDGEHSLDVRATDAAGNTGTLSLIFITDDTPPEVSGPETVEYVSGTTGHAVEWTLYDDHPFNYSVTLDGESVAAGGWTVSGQNVTVNVDGLSVGNHSCSIVVFDEAGNSVSHSVEIVVFEAEPTTTGTTTTETTTTSTTTTTGSTTTTTTGVPTGTTSTSTITAPLPGILLSIDITVAIVLLGGATLVVVVIVTVWVRRRARLAP